MREISDIDQFQIEAARTIRENDVVYFSNKLEEEACEVIEQITFHDDDDELALELGDVLRCVCQIATIKKIPMSVIADRNVAKMIERFPQN